MSIKLPDTNDPNCGRVPTILDNREGNTVLSALQRLLPCATKMHVATGTFEIGSLLALDEQWQALEKVRIIMGDETTKRTKRELVSALAVATNENIEAEKTRDDALSGLPAVKQALSDRKIAVRTYPPAKFHAKAYIMDAKPDQPVDYALVGSSNFTRPGLTQNMELNLFTSDRTHITELRNWYEQVWREAEDVNADLLKVIEPHLAEYDPFTVYAKALKEYFHGKERSQDEWEASDSAIYKWLSQYQRDGYHRALQIADEWGGVLVCDGVGLGKTYIGLMVLERCLHERKRVLLIVPKSGEQSVWRSNIERLITPNYPARILRDCLEIRRHTDFGRENTVTPDDMRYYAEDVDVIIIDEAHHFRNPISNRGEQMMRIAKDKKLFLLTATPINNKLDDLYHLINYFAQDRNKHFARIGIQNLRQYFIDADKRIEAEHAEQDIAEAADSAEFLRTDALLKNVLIQRSRKYVKQSESLAETAPLFPERQLPRVINYSLKSVYASLYSEIKDAFHWDTPFLSLAIYNTAHYAKNPEAVLAQRQTQVVSLIRTLLLKRLESSYKAFEASVEGLLYKMARFMRTFAPEFYEAWTKMNTRWFSIVQEHIEKRLEIETKDAKRAEDTEEAEEEDDIPEAFVDFDPEQHRMGDLLGDIQNDMEQLTVLLSKLYRRFYTTGKEGKDEDPSKDDKLKQLVAHLKGDPILKGNKVVIFTEFRDTARYLARQLRAAGIKHLDQIDSGRKIDRETVIKRFSPYYNCEIGYGDMFREAEDGYLQDPINVLVSTDVLSEGLNLQDASLVINYDLHWNPVRLMQRIGRVDRRLNPVIEARLERPKKLDRKVFFWNFLPPDELEDLLGLVHRLTGKITRINRTLGIEGALLTPDDPAMSLKEFNERYEGRETIEELMSLERQRLAERDTDFWNLLDALPRRLFSGKALGDGWETIVNRKGERASTIEPGDRRGVVCAYRMPSLQEGVLGEVIYYLYDAESGSVLDSAINEFELRDCWRAIRCAVGTSRRVEQGVSGLAEARKAIERHIKNTQLKAMNAPLGADPILIAWMEIA